MKTHFTSKEIASMLVDTCCANVPKNIREKTVDSTMKRLSIQSLLTLAEQSNLYFKKIGKDSFELFNPIKISLFNKSKEFKGYVNNSD